MSKRHALDAPADQQRASIPPIPSGDVGISGSAEDPYILLSRGMRCSLARDRVCSAELTHADGRVWCCGKQGAVPVSVLDGPLTPEDAARDGYEVQREFAASTGTQLPTWEEQDEAVRDSWRIYARKGHPPTEGGARAAYRGGVHTRTWTALNEAERNAWRGHVGAPKVQVGKGFKPQDDGPEYFPPPPLDSAWQPDAAPSPLPGDGGTLALHWRDSGATHQLDAELSANEAQQVASYVSCMLKGRST